MLTQQNIRFVVIRNPMTPDNRLVLEREWSPEKSLYDYIGDLSGSYAISVNGGIVDQEQLSKTSVMAGDIVVICPILHGGGGGGKNVLRLVATVALMIVAPYAAPALGVTGVAANIVTAAVVVGGTLLINAVLPPVSTGLSLGADSDSKKTDYTYGLDGPKNSSKDNIPVPLVYGRHRQGGNIVGNYTEQQGSIQYLNMLINMGEGVIAGIDLNSIQINDQPISSLSYKPEVSVYYGNDGQRVPGGFSRQIIPVQVTNSPELSDPSVWTEYLTAIDRDVEAVQANVNCSIVRVDDRGNEQGHHVDVEIQIASDGTSEWAPLSTGVKYTDGDKGYLFDYVDAESGGKGRFDASGKTVTKVKRGSQRILSIYPNTFDANSNRYDNHYVSDGASFKLKGRSVNTDGTPSTTVYKSSKYGGVSKEKTGAPDIVNTAPPSYDYGDLFVDGVKVGTYHDFHVANKVVRGVNDSGLEGGTRSGRTLRLYGSSSSANQRYSFESARLAQGRYKIRARRLTEKSTSTQIRDDVAMNEINEILFSSVAYNYTALLRLRIRVTDQIGNIPKVTYESLGRIIRVWDEETRAWHPSYNNAFRTKREMDAFDDGRAFTDAEKKESSSVNGTTIPNKKGFERPAHMLNPENTERYQNGFYQHDNPAWIALDILTDDRFGAGIPIHRVDFFAFKEWAQHCEENNLHYRGVISTQGNVWDTISSIFKVGRAVPLRTGTRYSVAIEKPKMAVMRFGQDNIIKDTFSTAWLPLDDRANQIELTFFDEKMDYRPRTIKVYDKEAIQRGARPITASVTVSGIVSEEQAIREAIFSLNYNKLIQTVSFEAPVEALACTIGDVISVQHNMMNWGLAGKLSNALSLGEGSYELTLDQEFTFDSNEWQMVLSSDTESKGIFQVGNIYGNYVTLIGFDANSTGSIQRGIYGEKDVAVLDTFKGSDGQHGVVIQEVGNLSVGDTIELVATDVLSSVSVTPSVLGVPTSKVTVDGLTVEPKALDGFMIGHQNFESRKFTVRSIGLTGDSMTRKITALEYDERALGDQDSDFTIEDTPVEKPLEAVENITISDEPFIDGLTKKTKISISWTHGNARYKDALVTAKIYGIGDQFLGSHPSSVELIVESGRLVDFIIVPRDVVGKEGMSTTVQHVSEGGLDNPYLPINVKLENITGGAKISWQSSSQYLLGVEVFAIKYGTEINGTVVELDLPESYGFETVVEHAEKLGRTNQGSYTHITETSEERPSGYFYWVRSVDLSGSASDIVYAGMSSPLTSASYNSVAVYQWSVSAPSKPTGGSYENSKPDQEEWSIEIPTVETDAPSNIKLWQSTRRFCNVISLSDTDWSLPASISKPGDILYTWIMYAEDVTGSGISTVRKPESKYIGRAYNKVSPQPSNNPEDYDWELLLIDEVPINEIVSKVIQPDLENLSLADLQNLVSFVEQKETIDALFYGPEGSFAKITETKKSVASAEAAIASVNTTLTAKINEHSSSISTNAAAIATADGTYQAQWGVKTSVDGLQGGVGFFNDGSTTQFLVKAETFAVVGVNQDGESTVDSPFQIVNGKTVINDAWINKAYIDSLTANFIETNELKAVNIMGGQIDIGDGRFKVLPSGLVKATDADIQGRVTASEVEGSVIRGSVITGSAIQASYIAADVPILVLTWANQEQYGSMSVEYLESQGITPYTAYNIGVSGDSSQSGVSASLNIASYNNSNKNNQHRYSRKKILPEGSFSNFSSTITKFEGSGTTWNWSAQGRLKGSFKITCGSAVTTFAMNTDVSPPLKTKNQSSSGSKVIVVNGAEITIHSTASYYYTNEGSENNAYKHLVLNISLSVKFPALTFSGDGLVTVDFGGLRLEPYNNENAPIVFPLVSPSGTTARVYDTPFNATTPTNEGPN